MTSKGSVGFVIDFLGKSFVERWAFGGKKGSGIFTHFQEGFGAMMLSTQGEVGGSHMYYLLRGNDIPGNFCKIGQTEAPTIWAQILGSSRD